MNTTVFRLSRLANFYITLLVAGLMVFVWLHWRGDRQTELFVFLVLTLLAITLYTPRGELVLSQGAREITGKRTWLGITLRQTTVRLGNDDALFLTEDLTHNKGNQGVGVIHRLEASGELVSKQSGADGPYILISENPIENRAALEVFAENAAASLGVVLNDSRKFSERVKQYRADNR